MLMYVCVNYESTIDSGAHKVMASDLDPSNATLLSNRSLCWLRLGQADHALADATTCRTMKPDWAKAWYREGAALRLLQRFDEAANAFYEGVQRDPENMELVKAFRIRCCILPVSGSVGVGMHATSLMDPSV
ncbi:Heat shock protein sti1-like protein [Thalictrum thalictroides]|uniref:Heat shock protein sti1-like protein n=1 Tax=Thalictrum thalictroides TaxID=46969 RepID=A0A7J6WEH9_THATH|nr:Heat shock protein sti1-like protein [Thalictrum thalictroides]